MSKGTIKKISSKGFGFIEVEGAPKEIFFHASGLKGTLFNELKEGDTVEFEGVEPTDKGQKAVGITVK